MPIEIREIVIKTAITSTNRNYSSDYREKDLHQFRRQLLDECKRMLSENTRRNSHKR